jgi:iron complex outermembrane recepter protein
LSDSHRACAVDAAAAGGTTNTQMAGQELEEVVVTAQKRSEDLQSVPITISAFSAEELTKSNVGSLQDLTTVVAGFNGPGDNGTNPAHIRGVGNGVISPGNESGVSYYIDGVYFPTGVTMPISLDDDVTQVEVLKGPQGTLFGRNSTAGAVLVTTRSPTDQFEAQGQVGYGNYETLSGSAYVGGPVTDGILASLFVADSHQNSPWGRNLIDNAPVGEVTENLVVNNKWIFKLTDDTEVQLAGDIIHNIGFGTWNFRPVPQDARTALGVFTNGTDPWNTNASFSSYSYTTSQGGSVKVSQDLHFAKLTSVTGYENISHTQNLDADATPINAEDLITAPQISREVTEELQLSSELPGPIEWTAGIYYLVARDLFDGSLLLPLAGELIPLFSHQDTHSIAGYAQGAYEFPTGTKLTLGARYTSETKEAAPDVGPKSSQSITANVPTWRAALDQRLTDSVSVYAAVSRGFKSGGFNMTAVTGPAINPEYLTDYEIGAKTELFDHRLRFNLAGFYYQYSGIQIEAVQGGTEVLYNAAGAHLYGIDADFEAKITSQLTLSGTLEGLHSEYTDFPNAEVYTQDPATGLYSQGTGSATGNQLVQAPVFTGSLTASYRIPSSIGNFDIAATNSYNDGYFTTPDNHLRQPSFDLVSASVRWTSTSEKVWVRAWGKNLTNEFTYNVLSIATPLPATAEGFANAPRTFGISVGVKY